MGLWKTLRKEWEVVRSRLFFVVGNGQRVKFWKDIWCRDEPLCVSFPSLFALTVSRMLGLRMCGGAMRVGEVGARFFLDRLMIGSWTRFAVFLWP